MFECRNINILNKANKAIFHKNLNFTINTHEIWRIKGANGVGKSSLYEALIGLRHINTGEITFNEVIINNLPANKRILLGMKYIAQNNSLFNNLTIKENLELFAEYLVNSNEKKDILDETINLFQLNEFINKYPNELSGGQKRLSELSKLMIGPKKLILLDEPFAAIDQNIINKLLKIFLILKENGSSFLINDHNIESMDKITNYDISIYPKFTRISKNLKKTL